MTAEGDIIYGGSSGTGTRLAKGSDAQVLTLASGVPTWATSTVGDLTSIVAGTGLTGSSLTSGDATLNVIGGTGITANANDIATDASQGHVTTVGALDAGSITSGFGNIGFTGAFEQAGGAVAFNQGSGDYDFKIESDGTDNILHVDGGVNGGKGSVTLGYSANPDANNRAFFKVYPPAITTASGKSTSWASIQPDYAMTMAGTVPVAASLAIEEPNLSGTPTLAATLYIKDAPTEATTNAAIYVASGDVTIGDGSNLNLSTPLLAGTDHTTTGMTAQMLAGGAIAAFDLVCIHSTTQEVVEADASAAATSRVIGIAPAAISDTATGTVLLQGFVRDDTWTWTTGGVLFLSETAGAMTHTAPTTDGAFVQAVGVALSPDVVYINPSIDVLEHA
jgi:hypothetical protein